MPHNADGVREHKHQTRQKHRDASPSQHEFLAMEKGQIQRITNKKRGDTTRAQNPLDLIFLDGIPSGSPTMGQRPQGDHKIECGHTDISIDPQTQPVEQHQLELGIEFRQRLDRCHQIP